MINTNAIRAFNEKIKASQKMPNICMSMTDAKNLSYEITALLAYLIEIQANNSQKNDFEVEISGGKF